MAWNIWIPHVWRGSIFNPEWDCTFFSIGVQLEQQVAALAKKAFAQIHLVQQLHPYLHWEVLKTFTHSLVTSELNYYNTQLWDTSAFTAALAASGLPVQFRVLIMTYKPIPSIGPVYLRD